MAVTMEMRLTPRICPSCGERHEQHSSDRCALCVAWEHQAFKQYYGRLRGVYFVQSGAFIKIGVSWHIISRVLNAAWAWNPHEVTPLGWIPQPTEVDTYAVEERIHREFAADHHRGEWFRVSDALLSFIAHNVESWPRRPRVSS